MHCDFETPFYLVFVDYLRSATKDIAMWPHTVSSGGGRGAKPLPVRASHFDTSTHNCCTYNIAHLCLDLDLSCFEVRRCWKEQQLQYKRCTPYYYYCCCEQECRSRESLTAHSKPMSSSSLLPLLTIVLYCTMAIERGFKTTRKGDARLVPTRTRFSHTKAA